MTPDEWTMYQTFADVLARFGVGLVVLGSVAAALVVLREMSIRRRAKVYIAGGSSERLTVCRPLIESAQRAGVEIAADWTRDPGWDLGRMPTDEEFRESAGRDLAAIRRADIVWLVVPVQKSEGAAAEIGYALALGKRLVVSGETGARNIFALLAAPGDTFARHEDAFEHVVRLSRRRETSSAS